MSVTRQVGSAPPLLRRRGSADRDERERRDGEDAADERREARSCSHFLLERWFEI